MLLKQSRGHKFFQTSKLPISPMGQFRVRPFMLQETEHPPSAHSRLFSASAGAPRWVGIFSVKDGENDTDGGDTDPNGGTFVYPDEIIAFLERLLFGINLLAFLWKRWNISLHHFSYLWWYYRKFYNNVFILLSAASVCIHIYGNSSSFEYAHTHTLYVCMCVCMGM